MSDEKNLFLSLSKYKPTEFLTPLENFTTEAFVWILFYLKKKKNSKYWSLLELFGVNNNENVEILTQVNFYTKYNEKSANLRPDICIYSKDKVLLIEVKVNSALHGSLLGLRDQLDDYSQIKQGDKAVEVYSLTKYKIFSESIDELKKILWSKIIDVLKDETDEFIQQFVMFLKDNDVDRIEHLTIDVSKIYDEQKTFFSLLEESFSESKFNQNFQLANTEYKRIDGNGYYVIENDEYIFWFGILPNKTNYLSKIVFEVMNGHFDKIEDLNFETAPDNYNKVSKNQLCINELLKKENRTDQIEMIKDWLNEIFETINQSKETHNENMSKM